MFRSMNSEGQLSSGQSSSSPAGHEVPSPGLHSQESSWIGLLSVVSRPAMSFLQRYLPDRARSPALPDGGAGWMSGDFQNSFVDEEREFFRQLDPGAHLTYLRCQQHGAAGMLEPTDSGTLPWITPESLREISLQGGEEVDFNVCQQTQVGYLSSARTFLGHVRLGLVSSQEINPTGEKDWVTEVVGSSLKSNGGKSRTWWRSFWGGESSQKGQMSDVSRADERSDLLCPQQPAADTNASAAETTAASVQNAVRGWTLGENTGPPDHKDQPANNGGLQTAQNTEASTPDQHLSNHLSRSGAAAPCSEVAVLTPDQDNGYSSLEEEHVQMCQYMVKPPSEELPQQELQSTEASAPMGREDGTAEEGESTSGKPAEEEREEDEQDVTAEDGQSVEAMALTNPPCQNKAIAFIMGCPCSDDEDAAASSQSDGESSDDDDDDDGFDSEGSSDLSESSDEDDEDDDADSDSEADSEAERLWNSLCQSADPYNPRNFTARLQTRSTPPRTIPSSTPLSSTQSTPDSSPDLTSLPLSSPHLPPSSSPPSGSDTWDDSTSASEVDEAESLRLLSSFSCSSDPYSPFNFQATIRTRAPAEAAPRARAKLRRSSQSPARSAQQQPTSPPEYRKEEAEERLDSGFSELCTSSASHSCSKIKKVRFSDDVQEFFASCSEEEEDRRGPWEELARDRCRFLRRCQEVEQSIAYCLQPQHRTRVYSRLALVLVQDA